MKSSLSSSSSSSKDPEEYFKKLTAAKAILKKAPRIIIFTGAGMSADSGIATFRKSKDSGAFWEGN